MSLFVRNLGRAVRQLAGRETVMYQKILVAIDDSATSNRGLEQAVGLAASLKARPARAAAAQGVECDQVALDARAEATSDAICREAASRNCDLIVMGTHGRRGLKRLTLGSDADLVVRQTSMPVLLVRHAGSSADSPQS